MSKLNKQLGEYASQLCFAETFDDAFLVFDQHTKRLGFESALYSFIPRISLDNKLEHAPIFSVSDSYDPNYLTHYMEERLDKNDYIIKELENGNTRTYDWQEDLRNGQLTNVEKNVLDIACNDHQMKNGLSIPTLTGVKGIAAASVISSESDRLFSQLKKETYDSLLTSTKLFHNHAISNAFEFSTFVQPLLASLSETEKKVVKTLPKGLSVTCIAKEVGKSIRYTDNIIRNLRIKMGGLNEQHQPRISTKLLIYYIGLMKLADEL